MIQLFQKFSKSKCRECERCMIFYAPHFISLPKYLQLKILQEFIKNKSDQYCMTLKEYRKLQNDIWDAYKYQILMRDIQEHVELQRKLELVRTFNKTFTHEDVIYNTPKYLKALEEIERLFKQEFHTSADAIPTPKWKLIIRDKLQGKY